MAIGKSYPKDNRIQDADLFLGTKSSTLSTVNYTAQSVADYLNNKGKISIGGQMVFQFVIANPSTGTISLPQQGGDGDSFSSITNLIISTADFSTQNVVNFIDYIVDSEILLTEQNQISVFGNYKITQYEVTIDPDFYNLTLEYIGGYGDINKDLFYDLTFFRSGGSATTNDITADVTLGGISAQDIIPIGTDLQQFIEDLLTKTFNPTLNPPSFSLSYPAAIREIGSSAPITLTFNFDRGGIVGNTVSGIWQPGAVQGFRAGASSSYTIDGVTQPSNTLLVSPVLLPGGNPFNGTVTYGVGIQPKDSKGNDYLTPLAGGTSPTQSTTVQGIYPYFYYKSFSPITAASMQTAIASGAATKVLGDSTGTLAIPYNVSGQYMSVAYPNASTAKTKYFVSLFDQGALSDPTSPFNLGTVLPCNSIDSFWSNISYRIHVSPILTNPGAIIELRNS